MKKFVVTSGFCLAALIVAAPHAIAQTASTAPQPQSATDRELREIAEPFRTTVILRDIEELSYEEIAEIMQTSLGTVKSRVTRGRDALRKRLEKYADELGLAPGERKRVRGAYTDAEAEVAG